MIEIIVDEASAFGRVDKYIQRLLPGAPRGLLYKQFRKKNITLNDAKIAGNEIVQAGDTLHFYFSDETFENFKNGKFKGGNENIPEADIDINISELFESVTAQKALEAEVEGRMAYDTFGGNSVGIIYENEHILVMNKPPGILTQKSKAGDLSLNEWMLGYLMRGLKIDGASMMHFKPSVLNRLDRNTSGIVIAGKSLYAAKLISKLLQDRTLYKYYRTLVFGRYPENDEVLMGYHMKNWMTNMVNVMTEQVNTEEAHKYEIIQTGIRYLNTYETESYGSISELDVSLITGKSHQIRAHLSAVGYPIVGDAKYGNQTLNEKVSLVGIKHQLLHAYRIAFPKDVAEKLLLEQTSFETEIPHDWFTKLGIDQIKVEDIERTNEKEE
ncbi:MAG: RluA family pseudouridine synthase [Lachnospiraceae bacterium]|nr:RluA family pseudouridine synthase [Lachnospiraceae bacterium]